MKVVLASTSLLALPTYIALKQSEHEFLALITKSEERSGRGHKIQESELTLSLASEKIVRVSGHDDLYNALTQLKPDIVIAISFGLLVKPNSLTIPKYGWINLHFSLLPKFRGAAPLARAILAGESKSGVCVFQLDAGMDTGPIYRAREIPCDSGTNGELLEVFAKIGSEEVLSTLSMIEGGSAAQPQSGEPSFAPKISSDELRLNFELESHLLLRRIRAFSPRPGSWCEYQGKRIKIIDAKPYEGLVSKPGEVISLSPLVIGFLGGALEITKVQEAGKRLMTGSEWTRGSRVQVGDFFE